MASSERFEKGKWLLVLALLPVLAFSVWSAFEERQAEGLDAPVPSVGPTPATAVEPALPARAPLERAGWGRDPFAFAVDPVPVPRVDPMALPPPKRSEVRFPFALAGVSEVAGQRLALIGPHLVRVGEPVPGTGYVVRNIDRAEVVLESRDGSLTLALGAQEKDRGRGPK